MINSYIVSYSSLAVFKAIRSSSAEIQQT
jgi:hypothetical protein